MQVSAEMRKQYATPASVAAACIRQLMYRLQFDDVLEAVREGDFDDTLHCAQGVCWSNANNALSTLLQINDLCRALSTYQPDLVYPLFELMRDRMQRKRSAHRAAATACIASFVRLHPGLYNNIDVCSNALNRSQTNTVDQTPTYSHVASTRSFRV